MPMLKICSTAGCETKTLGSHCLEHERPLSSAVAVKLRLVEAPRGPEVSRLAGTAAS